MPTLQTAMNSIYKRMEAGWNLANAAVTYDGENYEPNGVKFVRLSVRHSVGTQRSIAESGQRRFRRQGRIIVQCFAPATLADGTNAGRYATDVLGDLVKDLFEAVSFESIDTYAATMREAPTQDGRYIGGIVEIPFDYDEIR